jgi:hypothetical protein
VRCAGAGAERPECGLRAGPAYFLIALQKKKDAHNPLAGHHNPLCEKKTHFLEAMKKKTLSNAGCRRRRTPAKAAVSIWER